MTRDEVFEAWAPPASAWHAWAKPVAFAQMADAPEGAVGAEPEAPLGARGDLAAVVDLPGEASVLMGVALARRGFRPVPMFNAVSSGADDDVVDMSVVQRALAGAARGLASLRLATDAPPAFLLDSRRRRWVLVMARHDNAHAVTGADFPSGTLLKERGLREIVLVQQRAGLPAPDLHAVLKAWQDAGLVMSVATPRSRPAPRRLAALPWRTRVLEWLKWSSRGAHGGASG
jgi:hypothetical protein